MIFQVLMSRGWYLCLLPTRHPKAVMTTTAKLIIQSYALQIQKFLAFLFHTPFYNTKMDFVSMAQVKTSF